MKSRSTLVALLIAGLAMLPSSVGAADGRQNCGKVNEGDGVRSPVKAYNLSCKGARKTAAPFIKSDVERSGWIYANPAGCEWFAYRKRDSNEVNEWIEDGAFQHRPHFPVVTLIKNRGCVS